MSLTLVFYLLGATMAHVEMVEPAPRRSQYLKGLLSGSADFGMNSPLGAGRAFPCIGYEKGPTAEHYQPGGDIVAKLSGSASHNGGHCQFSISYDGNSFVALKTVLGNCLVASKEYSVQLPKDAPSGDAVFAWTWINRTGNREYYMNCADIKIDGSQGGSIKGHEIVVAHIDVPGKKTYEFPEEFADNFGKSYFEETPLLTISPNKSTAVSDATQNPFDLGVANPNNETHNSAQPIDNETKYSTIPVSDSNNNGKQSFNYQIVPESIKPPSVIPSYTPHMGDPFCAYGTATCSSPHYT